MREAEFGVIAIAPKTQVSTRNVISIQKYLLHECVKHLDCPYIEIPGFVLFCCSVQANEKAPLTSVMEFLWLVSLIPPLELSPSRTLQAIVFKREFLGAIVLEGAQCSLI